MTTVASRSVDVVSDLLAAVRLHGAFYFNGEFAAPWRVRTPGSQVLAPLFGRSGQVIVFHLLTEGDRLAGLDGGPLIPLVAGDVVVFPHGDPHLVGSGADVTAIDISSQLQQILAQGLRAVRMGGSGEVTRFICGYLSCDPQLARVLLGSLPSVFKVHIRGEGGGQWLENAIRFSVDEAQASPVGGTAVRERLAEALFVETLRRHLVSLAPEQTGWLAGVRDRHVGRALALMHGAPAQDWTLVTLARAVGISRTVLIDRFQHFLGEPPMAYLTRWRLQLGARQLRTSQRSIAAIAASIGYESEPAFNRAFRREFGAPPGRYRSLTRQGPE